MTRFILSGLAACLLATSVLAEEPLVTWRNKLQLSNADYQAALQQIPEEHRFEFQLDMRRITSLLENTLVFRTLAAEARADKLDKDPLFKREMDLYMERLLATKRLQALEKSIKVPDLTPAAEEQYKLNKEKFDIPDTIEVAHLLVEPKRHGSEEQAQKRAQEARDKLAAGADFAAIVQEYTDDERTAKHGGALPAFGPGAMAPAFEKAAFALQNPGDISPVVLTDYGFHVIKLVKRTPGRSVAFEEVKPRLMKQLTDQYIDQQKAAYIAAIRNDKTIKMNTKAIDALKKESPLSAPAADAPKKTQ